MPAPADNYSQWTWEQGMQYLLDGGKDYSNTLANRELVAGPNVTWLQFVESREGRPRPEDFLTAGPNEIVAWHNLGSKFRWVRGKVTFYDAVGNGPSPFSSFMTFQYAGDIARDTLNAGGNQTFFPQSFRDASTVLAQVSTWLDRSGTDLGSLYESINRESSGFAGSAADAFAVVLKNLHNGVRQLHVDVAGPGQTSWAERVNGKAGDMEEFRTAFVNAWNAYQSHVAYSNNYFNPGHLIDAVRGIMEGAYAGNLNAVAINFGDAGTGTFDLTSEGGWQQLNTHVKNAWLSQVTTLDTALRQAVGTMATKFRDTQRNINKFTEPHQQPPPGVDGPNLDDGGGNGGGGDGKLGLDLDLGDGGGGGDGQLDLGGGGGGGGAGLNLGGGGSGGTGNLNLGDGAAGGGGGFGADLFAADGGPGTGAETNLGPGGAVGGLGIPGIGGSGSPGGGALVPGAGGLIGAGLPGGGFPIGASAGSRDPTRRGGGTVGSGVEDNGQLGGGTAKFPTAINPVDVAGGGGSSGSASLRPRGGSSIGPLGPAAAGGGGTGGSTGAGAALGIGALGGGGAGGGSGAGGGLGAAVGNDSRGGSGVPLVGGSTGSLGSATAGAGGAGSTVAPAGATPGGYPFMPPMGMGGMGAGNSAKDRERTTWLEEDEEVWGTDPQCAPAVIGRGDLPNDRPDDEPAHQLTPQRGPGTPYGPARTGAQRPGRG